LLGAPRSRSRLILCLVPTSATRACPLVVVSGSGSAFGWLPAGGAASSSYTLAAASRQTDRVGASAPCRALALVQPLGGACSHRGCFVGPSPGPSSGALDGGAEELLGLTGAPTMSAWPRLGGAGPCNRLRIPDLGRRRDPASGPGGAGADAKASSEYSASPSSPWAWASSCCRRSGRPCRLVIPAVGRAHFSPGCPPPLTTRPSTAPPCCRTVSPDVF